MKPTPIPAAARRAIEAVRHTPLANSVEADAAIVARECHLAEIAAALRVCDSELSSNGIQKLLKHRIHKLLTKLES